MISTSEFRRDFPRTAAIIHAGIDEGLHAGAQVYASIAGRTVADVGIGSSEQVPSGPDADDAPDIPITPDPIFLWLSSGKPIAAVAIARFWERGQLDLDDPVARHIPEFAVHGKQAITIRHLLTHTGGIRWADYLPTMAWDEVIQRISQTRPEPRWIIGHTAGYHAFTSWFILGEIIRRLDPSHRSYDQFVRDEIFEPLGMRDSWFALTPDRSAAYGDRIQLLRSTGSSHGRPLSLDSPERTMLCVPGASGRGPMRELARFYEMLLNHGQSFEGTRIITPQTVEALTARHRTGLFDHTFKHIVDWGLGFIVNSAQYGEETLPYGFGPHASPRAFGHGGSQSSVAMADPENHLVIALVFNGMPGEESHRKRMRATLAAMYEDLGLAGSPANEAGKA